VDQETRKTSLSAAGIKLIEVELHVMSAKNTNNKTKIQLKLSSLIVIGNNDDLF